MRADRRHTADLPRGAVVTGNGAVVTTLLLVVGVGAWIQRLEAPVHPVESD